MVLLVVVVVVVVVVAVQLVVVSVVLGAAAATAAAAAVAAAVAAAAAAALAALSRSTVFCDFAILVLLVTLGLYRGLYRTSVVGLGPVGLGGVPADMYIVYPTTRKACICCAKN